MIDESEINALAIGYGQPLQRHVVCEIGEELFVTRFMRVSDRRGEVALAIERPNGALLLHRKAHYAAEHVRLPTGGVNLGEPVLTAVLRETSEETGLEVAVQRFLAVIEYTLCFDAIRLPFVTYLFHLRETGGRLNANDGEAAAFSECQPAELPAIAATLRAIPGQRGYWGRWRAIAHEVASECFKHSSNAPAGLRER
ncbi:MAG TPA: NUDIX hydrolase [Anaerolineae bacterium]|nr:NUDIX hydrolase [Anaerolineae bacterium]HNU05633.1 NUDIX hydrolase [Anaerolineae bacterium]